MNKSIAFKITVIALSSLLLVLTFFWLKPEKGQQSPVTTEQKQFTTPRVWQIKSIDTMTYSRDRAREQFNNQKFDETIETQISAIKNSGANYVAIDTPYDEEFYPFLERWVDISRNHGLNIWYRGNFSGWEGWFGYKKDLTREDHLALMRQFINKNGHLFEEGDIFDPCPECENGGPGDPRKTSDVVGFRQFMIDEHQAANEEFRKIGKNVRIVGSMNYDVANLVMDEDTANSVGNLVVIDHYVKTPQKLADDIEKLAKKSSANIMLGEFGAPIPDIHGKLDEQAQAAWIEEALVLVSKKEEVIGLNYWVGFGGSTAIFNNNGSAKPAAKVLEKYFKLPFLP